MLKRMLAALLAGLLLMTPIALATGLNDRGAAPKATPRLPSCDDALAAMEETPTPAPTKEPAPDADEAGTAEMTPEALTAKGYVYVSTATQAGWLPLPDEGEYSWHLKQILPDGSAAENVVHVTADGVFMEDSTCDNHDCVQQGLVTLDNREERILGNMIICLPNQVFLQLFTVDEVREMLAEQGY